MESGGNRRQRVARCSSCSSLYFERQPSSAFLSLARCATNLLTDVLMSANSSFTYQHMGMREVGSCHSAAEVHRVHAKHCY